MVLRPEEIASQSEIYSAGKRTERLKSGVKTAAGLAGAGLSASVIQKIAPFFTEFLTPEIAVKGISKVSPQLGEFFKRGMQKGLPIEEGLDYLKNNILSSEEKPKDKRGIILQHSDKLDAFIKDLLSKGHNFAQVAAKALQSKEHGKIARKIEDSNDIPLTSLIRAEYGDLLKNAQSQQSEQQAQIQQPSGPQQQARQPSEADAALMASLQKILNM